MDSWEEFRAKQGRNSENETTLKYPQNQITASYPSGPWSRLEKQRDLFSPWRVITEAVGEGRILSGVYATEAGKGLRQRVTWIIWAHTL